MFLNVPCTVHATQVDPCSHKFVGALVSQERQFVAEPEQVLQDGSQVWHTPVAVFWKYPEVRQALQVEPKSHRLVGADVSQEVQAMAPPEQVLQLEWQASHFPLTEFLKKPGVMQATQVEPSSHRSVGRLV